ncbi:RnfABCDGE type electron transport complex subunit D [Metapseudomonas lalkuanensis]|uniref:RnfABCDGE type electron transport complex subunit D n=1 Tax=Metapseudomonas lalkuanensis TaxID=2604832 RepID=UPI001CF3D6A3|nr:RnfABCDGE type electron transport complex subunit D [Pseudomonas lalkuanensis]UCP00774.1 RnfABCDGE type electron transport complex subunit D [Pseudomonas lalkuanensis]
MHGGQPYPAGKPVQLRSRRLALHCFFIATDPVTSPDTRAGRILFGVAIGALTELIRDFGLYADVRCFAVLAANLLVPQIDRMALRMRQPWYTVKTSH